MTSRLFGGIGHGVLQHAVRSTVIASVVGYENLAARWRSFHYEAVKMSCSMYDGKVFAAGSPKGHVTSITLR